MQFQMSKKAFQGLNVKNNAPDDEDAFQKYMRAGFATRDTETEKVSLPELDQQAPTHDLITGPINDIANGSLGQEGTTQFTQGSILKLGDHTPLQYNFPTQKGVQALYEQSSSITSTPFEEWLAQHKKKGDNH